MRVRGKVVVASFLTSALLCGCSSGASGSSPTQPQTQTAAPGISTFSNVSTQNGAVIVSLAFTTPGSLIYYTVDGTTPTTSSTRYTAPFLVASNLTVKAIA